MDIWEIIADGLAVAAAAIAVLQAVKVKGYRDEILADRRRYALVGMFASAKRAREECKKVVRSIAGRPMRGVNPDDVIAIIQSCADDLHENCHRYDIQDLSAQIDTLKKLLKSYVSGRDQEVRYGIADSIYESLSEIIQNASQKMDS